MREKGDVLENLIFDSWPKDGNEWIRYEANSGAKFGENDLVTYNFSIECKRKLASKSLSLGRLELDTCIKRSRQRGKSPLWITETADNRVFAVLGLADFINIIKTNAILIQEVEMEVDHEKETGKD